MTVKWGSCAMLMICLAWSAGCRTSQPDLKPAKTAEQFVVPPNGGRYNTGELPKQAFDAPQDPARIALDSKDKAMLPSRGAMLPGTGIAGASGMRP